MSKVPEGELAEFIVKTRHLSSKTTDAKRGLTLIRNMANRLYRDYIGYTASGDYRLKRKGEPVFAKARAREYWRRDWGGSGSPEPRIELTLLGRGAILAAGQRRVLLGRPPGGACVPGAVDLVLADHALEEEGEDLYELLQETGATLISGSRLASRVRRHGPEALELDAGGNLIGRDVRVHRPACVRSAWPGAAAHVVELDGQVLFHAGPTALSADLELVGDLFDVDVLILPLGEREPMDPWAAARAVELVAPRIVVPVFYGESIDLTPFKKGVGDQARVRELAPGKAWEVTPRPRKVGLLPEDG